MIRSTLIAAFCTILAFTGDNQPEVIEIAADKELIPEGIAVHPETGTIYLSSLHQHKIIAINREGQVSDLIPPGADGFLRGLGMKLDPSGKTLWACSAYNDSSTHKTGLFQVELQSGKVLRKFTRTDTIACLFNDLVIDKRGSIYLTDTHQSSIFRWNSHTEKLERWLQHKSLQGPNGIALSPDEKTLFVASGLNGILKIDLASKELAPIASGHADFYDMDGLAWYNNSLLGATASPADQKAAHRILRFHLSPSYSLTGIDTIDIHNQYIDCPTTLAVHNNQLYVLAKTNIGVYLRNKANIAVVRDSLEKAIILRYALRP